MTYLRLATLLLALAATCSQLNAAPRGTVKTELFTSEILSDNRIGIPAQRALKIYLPPSYQTNPRQRYPVLYYCHNIFWSPSQMFEDGQVQTLLETGFAQNTVPEFILVATDYTSPTTGSLYENSTTSGRWIDYTLEEIIPFIDQSFRTLPNRQSRAIAGDLMGGRGALYLAITHPETFSCVYAFHPVATGNGQLPWSRLTIDWQAIHQASSFDELPNSGLERIFTAISQANLPNPDRPPFYCDFPAEIINGQIQPSAIKTRLVQKGFHLDEILEENLPNLRSLQAIAFDWGRFDTTIGHVTANREFSRLLADLSIEHQAEEYNGGTWDRTWTTDGRFATRLLPFLSRHLQFEIPTDQATTPSHPKNTINNHPPEPSGPSSNHP